MRRNRMLWLAVLAVLAALAAPAAAQANEVTKWNEIAQNTILAQPPITSAPPASVTFIAMVQGAVYDAVNSIDQTHRPYLLTRKFDQLASQEAAAATAAFRVLTLTFPEQLPNLQPLYEESLADVPAGPAKEEGIAAGIAAADAMLAQGHDRRQVLGARIRAIGGRCSRPMEVRSAIPAPGSPTGFPSCSRARPSFARTARTSSPVPPTPRTSTRSRSSAPSTARRGRRSRPTPPCL